MRLLLLTILLAACTESSSTPDAQGSDGNTVDSTPPTDAKVDATVDAMIDAMVDAPPDATPMNITTACMHACDALSVCFMEPAEPSCYTECAEDLVDCSAAQVQAVDDCSTQPCGDEGSGVISCLELITCINP